MRTLVIIVIAMLVPFTMWIAGCRQNDRQAAAFPKGPEVKNLARAADHPARPGAPVIPAAIDPEIAMAPDQPTFALLRSVMDREAAIASRYGDDAGLFVLPRQDFPELVNGPARPASGDLPEGREFWSVPAAPVMAARPAGGDIPDDISAMAPAGGIPGLFTPEPMLPFEFIPGVFMGGAVEHFDAPTPSAFFDGLAIPAPEAAPPAFADPPTAAELSLDNLRLSASELGHAPEKVRRPGGVEVERRLAAVSGAPVPAISRFSGAAGSVDVREALAPLPNLAAMSAAAEEPYGPDHQLALPIPPPSAGSPRGEASADAPETAAFMPKAPPGLADGGGGLERGRYMMDVRKAADTRRQGAPVPDSFAEIGEPAETLREGNGDAAKRETPDKKIVLRPAGETGPRPRASSLNRIDAMTEAPPIRD